MRAAGWINLLFFSSFNLLVWLRPVTPRRRAQAIAIGVAGIGLSLPLVWSPASLSAQAISVLRDWLPTLLMPMAYWQAGLLFTGPNAKLQSFLATLDRRALGIEPGSCPTRSDRRWWSGYLELAYLLCYPMIPLGVGVLYAMKMRHYVQEYWAVVLPSAYLCYASTAFFQALPPRASLSDSYDARRHRLRAVNLWIVRHASIKVNTFPSAHAAAAVAASLVLLRFAPPAGVLFLWLAASVAVGAVAGRYHYAADAVAGAALAVAVFLLRVYCG